MCIRNHVKWVANNPQKGCKYQFMALIAASWVSNEVASCLSKVKLKLCNLLQKITVWHVSNNEIKMSTVAARKNQHNGFIESKKAKKY